MGSVYRAADETLGRDVALKILDTSMEGAAARFRAEAAVLARLSHPGMATVYELIEDDGRLVMAMEYVRGQNLQQIVEHVGVFAPRRAAELCMQVLTALEHTHAGGIVHRDLKPANLILTDSGSMKIMDFGIARLEGSVNLTSAGAMLGTPAYMAPEQVLGYPVDARADLYAMGVVFFRLVTAALPFKGDTPFDMAQSQVNDPPANASDHRSDLPDWVQEILTRALSKKPGDRFQSAMEFHETFARAIGSAPPQPSVPSVIEATEMMARPHFDPPAVVVDTDEPPNVDESSNVIEEAAGDTEARSPLWPRTWWLIAGVAAALVAVWMFTSSGSVSPDNPEPVTAAFSGAASQPASQPVVTEPEVRPAQRDGAATVSPAAFTPSPAAGRSTITAKAAISSEAEALPPVSFTNVKLLAVNGVRTTTSDVVVQFSGGEVTVQQANGKAAPATLAYQRIAKVTYAHGRDPKWDPTLNGPPEKIDVPGILGRSKHWLVLQAADGYFILRLDGEDRLEAMKAFEERAHMLIDRPPTVKKTG